MVGGNFALQLLCSTLDRYEGAARSRARPGPASVGWCRWSCLAGLHVLRGVGDPLSEVGINREGGTLWSRSHHSNLAGLSGDTSTGLVGKVRLCLNVTLIVHFP